MIWLKLVRQKKLQCERIGLNSACQRAILKVTIILLFKKIIIENLGPQDSTTIIAEEVTMRFIHADQTEEDAEEEDEMMSKIRRQIDYMQFFQGNQCFYISK